MNQDHYDALGVAPTAPAAVIRAAYLALMREYHPDRNPSPAAAEKAQGVIAAYKVLGDFDRRSAYDWDRRRAREAAEGVSVAPKRRKAGAVPILLAAAGLTAVAALVLIPTAARPLVERAPAEVAAPAPPQPEPDPPVMLAEAEPAPLPEQPPLADLYPIEPVEPIEPIAQIPGPVRVAAAKPARAKPKMVETAPSRPVARATPAPRLAVAVARKASPAAPAAATRAVTTDLASIDQFAMNFYGQSWRFGDAPKRAVLEQARASYVTRRGECAGEECKRAATLKLMRDVSAIVEGKTTTR